jgi:hypothetical protein
MGLHPTTESLKGEHMTMITNTMVCENIYREPELAAHVANLEVELDRLTAELRQARNLHVAVKSTSKLRNGVALTCVNGDIYAVDYLAAGRRWAQVYEHATKPGIWMVNVNGPGLNDGGELLTKTFVSHGSATDAAEAFVAGA